MIKIHLAQVYKDGKAVGLFEIDGVFLKIVGQNLIIKQLHTVDELNTEKQALMVVGKGINSAESLSARMEGKQN